MTSLEGWSSTIELRPLGLVMPKWSQYYTAIHGRLHRCKKVPAGYVGQLSNFLSSNEGCCVFQNRGKNQGDDGHELEQDVQ